MISIRCKPLSASPSIEPLEFDWDERAGTVTGRSADIIRESAAEPGMPVHPMPGYHEFSAEPLKSRADVAAIVGYLHELPAELADAYPAQVDEPVVAELIGSDGTVSALDVLY
ncbi:MAG: hypothetical protein J0L85_15430 [Zoogloea sp.]|nr:hypothetical protein [Zoogloea sp.]MCA0185034.1 hypothetical protein [Pseudomonadota bacterium]